MSLDTWLRSRSDRCPHCGVHPEKQAELHKGGCLTTGERLREHGIQVASEARPDDRTAVDHAIRSLAVKRRPFSANDVRELTGGIRGGVVGAAFQAASRAGLIRHIGMVPSTDPGTHGHRISQWIGAAA